VYVGGGGPGNYNIQDSYTKKAAPKYGFGTGSRDSSHEDKGGRGVGPGQYDVGGYVGKEGMHTSMSPKLNSGKYEKESRNLPGPGSYQVTQTTLK
jgi:hypothetical protein